MLIETPTPGAGGWNLPSEVAFASLVRKERRRAERSGRGFVVVTVHAQGLLSGEYGTKVTQDFLQRLRTALRSTDCLGWNQRGVSLGILCTETGTMEPRAAASVLRERLEKQLATGLPQDVAGRVCIAAQTVHPERGQAKEEALTADVAVGC